jgi:hypothetical protein
MFTPLCVLFFHSLSAGLSAYLYLYYLRIVCCQGGGICAQMGGIILYLQYHRYIMLIYKEYTLSFISIIYSVPFSLQIGGWFL